MRGRGFSLVEAVLALAMASVVMGGALALVPAMASGGVQISERVRLEQLALALLDETGGVAFEGSALAFGFVGREGFDDLGDYAGWSSSPPERRDGTVIAGFDGVRREVEVVWLDPATLAVSGVDTGVRRVTVTARRGTGVVARVVAIRTRGGEGLR